MRTTGEAVFKFVGFEARHGPDSIVLQAPGNAVDALVHGVFLFADEVFIFIPDGQLHFYWFIFAALAFFIAGTGALGPFAYFALSLDVFIGVGKVISAGHEG